MLLNNAHKDGFAGSESAATTLSLRPEDHLLLRCCLVPLASPFDHEPDLQHLDWNRLFQRAVRHGLAPLLYDHLKTQGINLPASKEAQDFASRCRKVRLNSLLMTSELLRILDLLEEHRIMALPFKGPVLAHALYGNVTRREFSDLDILVRKEDVLRTKSLLESLGYLPTLPLSSSLEQAYLSSGNSEYNVQSQTCRVEIHWRFVRPLIPCPPVLSLWQERLKRIPLGRKEVRTLDPELLLWVLLAHGAMHRWKLLRWVVEIGRLIHLNPQMPWSKMLQEARASKSERVLFWGLGLAHQLFALNLPDELLDGIRADATVQWLVRKTFRSLFRPNDGHASSFQGYLGYIDYFALEKTIIGRLRKALRIVFVPTTSEWLLLPLPAPLRFLHYFLRPVRLMIRLMNFIFCLATSEK